MFDLGNNKENGKYKQIHKPYNDCDVRNPRELIPHAQELIETNRVALKEYLESCETREKENINNLKNDEMLKKDFEWISYILRGESFFGNHIVTIYNGKENVSAECKSSGESHTFYYNYDPRHYYERPEDLLGFDTPCKEIKNRIDEIVKEILDEHYQTEVALKFKHIGDLSYIYDTSNREYDKFQERNEEMFLNYKRLREKYYGGSLYSIAMYVCHELRQKDNYFLKTHYCPEYARNRAIVYKIFQHRGWELNDENKEKFKYELLERAYLRMASRTHKYFKRYTPCTNEIDYYENIQAYGGKSSTSLAKVVLSFAGYVGHDYFEEYRQTSLDYIICIYSNILFDLFPIEEYKDHFYFRKISEEASKDMTMYQYVFEENLYDTTKSARRISTFPEKALAKNPINPPFMLESCIDRAERLKRQMRDYVDTYDISKLKFASEYNRMKYEYCALVNIWSETMHRILCTCYSHDSEIEYWKKIFPEDNYKESMSFEEYFHTENDKIGQTSDGRWTTFINRTKYERQKKEEVSRYNQLNEKIEKEGRRQKPTLFKYTKEGLKESWEHQLGKYKDNPNWNILSFENMDKDEYSYEHRPNTMNALEAKTFLDCRKKTKFTEWEHPSILNKSLLTYTPFLLVEEDTIISDDINKLFQIPEIESSLCETEYDYPEDYHKFYGSKQKYEHFPFTINTYRTGIFRYTEEYLRLERLAVKMKHDTNFNEAIESLQELIEMGYPKEELIQIIDELEQKEKEYNEKRKASEVFSMENDDFEMHS